MGRRFIMRRRKGFTLIEILVVIAVIALLLALLMPVLQLVREQSRAIVCRSNLKQWGAIFVMYTNENDGLCPMQKFYGLATPDPWMHLLQGYSKAPGGISCCPSASKPAQPVTQGTGISGSFNPMGGVNGGADFTGARNLAWGKLTFNIESKATPDYYGSYGHNNWLSVPDESGMIIIGCRDNMELYRECFFKSSNVKGAGNIPVFMDGWWWCSWVKEKDKPPEFENQKNAFPCGCEDSIQRFCMNRHNGFVNGIFLDGAVRKVGLKELWILKWHRNFNTAGQWTKSGGIHPDGWPQWMRNFKDY